MSLSHNELIDSWGGPDPSSICGRARSQSIRVTYFIDRVFIFLGDTLGCHNDNQRCSRWQWGWHRDSSCWSSSNVLSDSSLCFGIANVCCCILSYLRPCSAIDRKWLQMSTSYINPESQSLPLKKGKKNTIWQIVINLSNTSPVKCKTQAQWSVELGPLVWPLIQDW